MTYPPTPRPCLPLFRPRSGVLAAAVVGLLAIVPASLPTLSAHAQETPPATAPEPASGATAPDGPAQAAPDGPTQAAPALGGGAPDRAGADGQQGRSASAPAASPAPPAGDPAPGVAPAQVAQVAQVAQAHLPQDLSPINMFRAADIVVKAVMIGLAFASVLTWTVLLVKALELWRASAAARAGLNRIARAESLSAVATGLGGGDAVSCMIRAAAEEYHRSLPALAVAGDDGLRERVESRLERIEAVAARRMARGTGILASIGSTAPFVGLFGTVWGIMNSFIGISEAQTTNLAVVAPGIAEALLATAIGLVAAIPAVVIYNVFARAIAGYRLRLSNAAAALRQLVSRDLDFRGLEAAPGGH